MQTENNSLSFSYKFPKDFVFHLSVYFILFLFLNYPIFIELYEDFNCLVNYEFYTILLVIYYYYFYNLGLEIFHLYFNIEISDNGILKATGLRYFKKNYIVIDLHYYNYKLLKIINKSTYKQILILQETLSNKKIFIILNNNQEVIQIYNYLLENYPENNEGKRWRFLFFGNDWWYRLKPYILKFFSKN